MNRAFRAARLLDNPRLRRVAFAAAGLGVLLAGGGAGLALLASGVALAALPTRERARAHALSARLEDRQDLDERGRRLKDAYDDLAREHALDRGPPALDFAAIKGGRRMIAGALAHAKLTTFERPLSEGELTQVSECRRALGSELAGKVEAVVERGSGHIALVVLRWCQAGDGELSAALATALDVARRAPRSPAQGRDAGFGMDRRRSGGIEV